MNVKTTSESKAKYVEGMFARISPKYDLLNDVMTLGMHRVWKKRTAALAVHNNRGPALDVATGTGDLALELARRPGVSSVVGVDFCAEMLELGRRKVQNSRFAGYISFSQGDALNLPFPNDSFMCATSGFALRNVDSIPGSISEMRRVVRPGGRVVTLELTPLDSSTLLSPLLKLYFSRWVPLLGQILAGDREAYTYLPNSVTQFPSAEHLAVLFREVGLERVNYRLLNLGTVAIHWGTKPA